jgi:hypothetical protein
MAFPSDRPTDRAPALQGRLRLFLRPGDQRHNYRMSDTRRAHIFVGVTVRDRGETSHIVQTLRRAGFATLDFSDDELAKGHVRTWNSPPVVGICRHQWI